MEEEALKAIAGQLRQPQGEYAIQVGKKMNEGNLHINLNTIEALRLSKDDQLLEIGMGNGFFVTDILSADSNIHYTGCDFSGAMVEEALRNNEAFIRGQRAQFHLASAEQLPFEGESFNKVFSVNTLYFWDNQPLVFSEIRRVLKPEGQVIISIRPKSVMEHYPFVKYGFNMFTKEDLRKLLSENQFRVTDIIEKKEPEQELNGEKLPVETLIVCAEKI